MNGHRRPNSLAEVSEWSATWNDLSYHLADFLHEFQAQPRAAMLEARPRLLAPVFEGGEVCDAYLAATAATLAARLGESTPEWHTSRSDICESVVCESRRRHASLPAAREPGTFPREKSVRDRERFVRGLKLLPGVLTPISVPPGHAQLPIRAVG